MCHCKVGHLLYITCPAMAMFQGTRVCVIIPASLWSHLTRLAIRIKLVKVAELETHAEPVVLAAQLVRQMRIRVARCSFDVPEVISV